MIKQKTIFGEQDYDACLASVSVKNLFFDFDIWAELTNIDEKKVYLFITQPPVRYVSIKSIANELDLPQTRVIEVLFSMLERMHTRNKK